MEVAGDMTAVNFDYHGSRLTHDERRDVLWQSLWRYYFSTLVDPDDCVLDLGAGYGNFINYVVARRRIAIDVWAGFTGYLALGIEHRVGNVADLDFLADGAVDFSFASNLFEHLTQAEFAATLRALRRKLSPKGTLTVVQPNYRYASREYFA